MVFCAVIGCSNNSQKTQGVSYYRFPSLRNRGNSYNHPQCAKRLAKWIKALKRADLTLTKVQHERVCSRHFISGSPANIQDEENPDWVPSLNLGYTRVDGKLQKSVPDKDESDIENDELESQGEDETSQKSKVYGTTCIVNSCKNNLMNTREKGLNVSYYRFPVDENLLSVWKEKCKIKNDGLLKSARICSQHFKEEAFQGCSYKGKRALKPQAVPSLNLDGEISMPKKRKLTVNDSNSENEGSDDETLKVRIAPMDEESSDERINKKVRRLSGKVLSLSPNDYSYSSLETDFVDLKESFTPRKRSLVRSRKVFDNDDYETEDDILKEDEEEAFNIVMPPSLGSMLKEGKLVPDDRAAIIKVIEERILEHSRIIEDNNVSSYSLKSKRRSLNSRSLDYDRNGDEPIAVPVCELRVVEPEEKEQQKENSNSIESDEVIEIPEDYEVLKRNYLVLIKQKSDAFKENVELKQKLIDVSNELQAKNEELKTTTALHENVVSKLTKIETCLSKMLTPNQIKLLLNDVKKVSWTPQEMLSAFTIRYLSKRCYYYLRQKLNYPLPGISSVQRWASVMTKQHGNLKEVENAVFQISGDYNNEEEDEVQGGEEDDNHVLYFPDATDDVVIEGTNDEETHQNEENVQEEFIQIENSQIVPKIEPNYKEHVIYLKQEQDWDERGFEEEEGEEYVENEQSEERTEEDGTSEGPLLKALLIGEKGEQSENTDETGIVTYMQEDGTITNEEGVSQNIIFLEAIEGDDPGSIQWRVAQNPEDGGQYYIANEEQLAQLQEQEQMLAGEEEGHKKGPVKVFKQELDNNTEILHYLYGINEVSPLNVNKSADHSYAIATIDKYIRTKERHKNRKPPKKS